MLTLALNRTRRLGFGWSLALALICGVFGAVGMLQLVHPWGWPCPALFGGLLALAGCWVGMIAGLVATALIGAPLWRARRMSQCPDGGMSLSPREQAAFQQIERGLLTEESQ